MYFVDKCYFKINMEDNEQKDIQNIRKRCSILFSKYKDYKTYTVKIESIKADWILNEPIVLEFF